MLESAWLLPLVSEYGLIGDNISELVLGRYGFIPTAVFLIAGLGTLGLACAIRRLTADARGSLVGSLLVAVYGVGAILSAIFPTDRGDSLNDVLLLSTTGTIHVVVSLVSFLCIIPAQANQRPRAIYEQGRAFVLSSACHNGERHLVEFIDYRITCGRAAIYYR